MRLPDGVRQLTTVEEVEAAWGDLFIVGEAPEGDAEDERTILFAGEKRIAITSDAVYVKLAKPVIAGPDAELTDVLRLREPTLNDIRLTDKYKGETEKMACLLTTLGQIPMAEAGRMPARDVKLVGEVLGAFLS